MKHKRLIIVSILLLAVFAAGAGSEAFIHSRSDKPVISKEIAQQVHFSVFYPMSDTGQPLWQISKDKTSYDAENGVLTMISTRPNSSTTVTLTQQMIPDAFKDVPTQYAKMLNSMNQYQEIKSQFNTVTLTRPKELKGGQTAVVNKGDTLMFAKPSTDLTDNEWQSFFDTFRKMR
jgi:hypothetical protein